MEYISTRNNSEHFSFKNVFLKGLADDGGLFVPKSIKPFSKENLNKLKNDQLIILGIRPHKIFFNQTETNFDGKASSSSYHWLGDQVHIGIEINGSSIIGVADRNFEPSTDVKLNFPLESINIFNIETEEVILNGL